MSGQDTAEQPTIEQMWDKFWRQATRNRPARKPPGEVRIAYYAGCHNMSEQMLIMMRSGQLNSAALSAAWHNWSAELARYSEDYNAGKV